MPVMTTRNPLWMVLLYEARKIMDVILHLGAHRTATTSFQHYLRGNEDALKNLGVGVWGPLRTRNGLLRGVLPVSNGCARAAQFECARGRIAVRLAKAEQNGTSHLIVSDENMIGAPRRNLRDGQLYAEISDRMVRYSRAFGDTISRVALSIRCQKRYWESALAFGVLRGHVVPGKNDLKRLAAANRQWRDVITDIATAIPDVDIHVYPYEEFGGQPETKLADMTGLINPPREHAREWLNRSPDLPGLREAVALRGDDPDGLPLGGGRWHPFSREQECALQEAYADDMYWLRAGAGGLATLIEKTGPVKAGQQPLIDQTTRGQTDGDKERQLA